MSKKKKKEVTVEENDLTQNKNIVDVPTKEEPMQEQKGDDKDDDKAKNKDDEKIKKLEKEIKRLKDLHRECCELNENRIATIEENQEIIKRLRAEVNAKNREILKKSQIIEELKEDLAHTKQQFAAYKALPWYKKIFKKS